MVSWIPHVYTLDGTKILHEDWGGNSLVPLYDNEDAVCGITYNGTPYYFQKNLQGDIIAITNANGEVVARYRYDAWGVPTITMDVTPINIATVNPFRYRGYYYDQDTGLYYLQSRYYDPQVGRFVNADEAEYVSYNKTVLLTNLFAYCLNNPINNIDSNGEFVARLISAIIGALIGAFTDVIAQALCYWITHKFSFKGLRISWGSVIWSAVVGLASGALMVSNFKKKRCCNSFCDYRVG